jgi:hypothetical protein
MFMASGAGGTHNSVVTPSLISAHVRLTVTPRNTLPHRHTTTELFFRKPTPLRNRHNTAFMLPHIDLKTPLSAAGTNTRIRGCRFGSFRPVIFSCGRLRASHCSGKVESVLADEQNNTLLLTARVQSKIRLPALLAPSPARI